MDEFEFSQGYLFYWDKIERCHYFLNNIIETASRGEEVTGRLVSFLLNVCHMSYRLHITHYISQFHMYYLYIDIFRIQLVMVVNGICLLI